MKLLASCANRALQLVQYFLGSAFRHRQGDLRSLLRLRYEHSRPNATQAFTQIAQALYYRPTLNAEHQLSIALRRSHADIRGLLAQNRLYNKCFESRRNLPARPSQVRRYCQRIQVPQAEEYLELLRTDQRSRVVASFHFGDFLYGSARLFGLESVGRRNFVLSLNRSPDRSFVNMAAGFGASAPKRESELLYHETKTIQLSQFLRSGKVSILLFCDLPQGLNQTIEVRLLGRSSAFSVGPALLALTSAAPLLPMINFSDGNRATVHLGRQLEPSILRGESLRQAAQRITQELVSFFETYLLRYPEQWRFISLLPSYTSRQN